MTSATIKVKFKSRHRNRGNCVVVFFPNGSGGYNYIYQYTDHLGNVRLSYAEDPSNSGTPTIIEENNYYPFGLKHKGYNNNISPNGNSVAQRWKYNVMELDESLGLETYDFGARNYDPALGRWMNIDPLAEYMRRHSPYTYAYDNPVAFIDPDGMLSQFAWGSAFGISTNVLGSLYSESEAARQKKERKRIYDKINEVLNGDDDEESEGGSDTEEVTEEQCTDCTKCPDTCTQNQKQEGEQEKLIEVDVDGDEEEENEEQQTNDDEDDCCGVTSTDNGDGTTTLSSNGLNFTTNALTLDGGFK